MVGTLECLVKKYKPCWACSSKYTCNEERESECLSDSKKWFRLVAIAVTPDIAEYKEKFDAVEASQRADAETIQRLNKTINAILEAHEHGSTDYQVDMAGLSGEFKLLSYGILELASVSMEDVLTGLPNRRNFDTRLDMEWRRAVRKGHPLSLILIDIDNFKNYNDSFGHPQGDEALRAVGGVLRKIARRPGDISARWGGEEFAVLLAETEAAGAKAVAESIRKSIESEMIQCVKPDAEFVTVSVGVTTVIPDVESDMSEFILEADKALYTAKRLGKNRVCVYNSKIYKDVAKTQ